MAYISDDPVLLSEWDSEKNVGLDPSTVSLGSNKQIWWKCGRGHSWPATAHNRSKGRGCPYCSGRLAWPGETDLATLYPALAAQWHPDKNGSVVPSQVRPGSNTQYWWRCEHGHEWSDSPNHRISGRGCPYCSHHRVLPEESLLTLYPEISKEWDYVNNAGTPEDYAPFSNTVVFWTCSKCGNRWPAAISNRTRLNSGCPVCANQKIVAGINDLATTHPFLISEWDNDKNRLLPSQVSAGNETVVWWKCIYGHSWSARISNRSRGIGCPICAKHLKTSVQEFSIFYYVRKAFPDAVQSYRSPAFGRREIDIYIPSLRVGIEYDGQNWHDSVSKDMEKDALCRTQGITLIRVREPACAVYQRDDPTVVLPDLTAESLQTAIVTILEHIGSAADITVDLKADAAQIMREYRSTAMKNNLQVLHPKLAEEWHPTLNAPLRPENVPGFGSKEKHYWLCPVCGYSWKASLDSRIRGSGCPVCAGRVVQAGVNDLAFKEPRLANEWNFEKNGPLTPAQFTRQSRKKVWWRCSQGHEWIAAICDRVRGTGCPVCAGKQVLKGFNDLESVFPDIAKEWDRDKNDKSPDEVTPHSGYRASWKCVQCGHSWQAPVYSRSAGYGCPQCARRDRVKQIKRP